MIVAYINSSKALFGIAIVLMNFGSKYVIADTSKYFEHMLNSVVGRKVILFCMFLIGSRDIITSLALFTGFTIMVDIFLNEKSRLSLLPMSVKKHFLKVK